jgi:hypothetical protein
MLGRGRIYFARLGCKVADQFDLVFLDDTLQQINADVTMAWIGYRHYNVAPNHIWMFAPFHWPFKTEISEALHHITP